MTAGRSKDQMARFREKVRTFLAAIQGGASDRSAAAEAGISRETLQRWRVGERPSDRLIRERMFRARAIREKRWLKSIEDAALTPAKHMPTGDWRAAAWLMERTNPEYAARQGIELSGAGGGPVQISESVEHRLALPDKERVARVMQLLQTAGKVPLLAGGTNGANGNGHVEEPDES
jgi:hypothetical protein